MGKIISLINTTPDGFVDSHYVNADPEFHEFVHELLADTKTVAFGRNSFELFQEVWPAVLTREGVHESQVRMANALAEIPKQVYTTSLGTTTWKNTTIVNAIDGTSLQQYKENGSKGLLTIGSPGLVAALIQDSLVDEICFCIQPLIGGNGNVRLFDKIKLESRRPLTCIGSRVLKTGVVILRYKLGSL